MKNDKPNGSDVHDHFISLLHDFTDGMFVTHSRTGDLHARPMQVARVADDGELWLITHVNSEKVEELGEDSRVSLTLQHNRRFVALSGYAEVVRDASLVHAMWKESWQVWFPEGKDDPALVLINIKPAHGEYWDNEGASRVQYMFQTAKAYITGQTPHMTREQQAKVDL